MQPCFFMVSLLLGTVMAYRAAVVEYYPIISDTPKSTILWNLNEYKNIVEKAKTENADIIVFPEYGLTTRVNNTRPYATLINDFSDVIVHLRSTASEHRIYLVVNLLEEVPLYCCESAKYYSTNLVFDRNGSLVAWYRKINLSKEDWLTPGDLNQMNVTFRSDFGVTFAMFTSHDILFENPSRSILKREEIKDVLYPNCWPSSIPFYSSLSIQHSYSVANSVNLLASGYNQPLLGFGGSGIYLGDGRIAETIPMGSPGNSLIIYEVPKYKKAKSECVSSSRISPILPRLSYSPPKNFQSSIYKFKNVNLTEGNISERICDKEFCCTFKIRAEIPNQNGDFYKIIAFDGFLFGDRRKLQIRICSLVSCEKDSIDSCGDRVNTINTTNFIKISVKGNFSGDMFYLPLTLNYDFQPLSDFLYCENLLEVENQKGVLAFGIFGQRNYANRSFEWNGIFRVFIFLFVVSLIIL